MSMYIGEALVGDGNEIAHIDLLIGSKEGPVGSAFAHALATQSEGHTNLLAVLTPNLAVKPATVLITKVTIKGMKQAVQMFRAPAQGRCRQGRGRPGSPPTSFPRARPSSWSSSAACSSIRKPRTTRKSTSSTTRPPSRPSPAPWPVKPSADENGRRQGLG